MVRIAERILTMDNREEILDALNDFSRKQSKEIPPLLEQFLKQVAKTGETLFPWTLLKALFVTKLEQVMNEFNEECINDEVPPCPNVENARFEVYRGRIMEAVHRFHGAPFTIQRLCELLTDPKRHYKRCDKFMRGLEKNVLVVSTVDPFGRKVVSESKNLVNGMDSNNSSSEESSVPVTTSSLTSTTPPVPSWPSPSSSSSPTTTWPVHADLITPSTAPLLEVCDLPDPKDGPLCTTSSTTPTSTESSVVNGHDELPSGSGSVELASDSSVVEATPSADLPVATNMEETVDSSDQQVAAEEMVGVEEESAVSTGISQGAAGVVEETVVDTPPVAAEVMKETTDATDSNVDVTSAASGDWFASITDQAAKSESSAAESQDHVDAESLNNSDAESREITGTGSQGSSASDSKDDSREESKDRLEPQTSGVEGESAVAIVDSSDVEPLGENPPADSSVLLDTECSKDMACSKEEKRGNEEQVLNENRGESSASKIEGHDESNEEVCQESDNKQAESTDTMPTSAASELSIANTSAASPTSSETEEQLASEPPVSYMDGQETDMTPASSEVSISQKASSSSTAADMESISSIISDSDEVTTTTTPTLASPATPSASLTEERCEVADTDSTTQETDSIDSNNSVAQAAESTELDVATNSSESAEAQKEAPPADSSQSEPMEQD